MFPPLLLYMRLNSSRRGIWLPLFLLWLLLLPLFLLCLAVAVVADVALFLVGARYHHCTLLTLRSVGLLGAMRGTVVHVRSAEDLVDIEIV